MQIRTEIETGMAVRGQARARELTGQTAGRAPDYLQGNVVILPVRYASDFLLYCLNNPKPCPLIGLSKPGDHSLPSLGKDIDIRTDIPRYRIYKDGRLVEEVTDIGKLLAGRPGDIRSGLLLSLLKRLWCGKDLTFGISLSDAMFRCSGHRYQQSLAGFLRAPWS